MKKGWRAMASTVYFMDARSHSPQTGLVPKMLTVFEAAGFDDMVKPGDVVAIKLHCGEWNNTAYLRPVYARALADRVKSLGGRPFVCDTTTLPYNMYAARATELDLLTTAERNGYSPAVLGCPFICADGFMGTDDYRVELPEGYLLKEAYIASAIAAADVLLVLTHFKGHGMGIVGGAIKNLGIGAQSKRGKFNGHMGGHPRYGLGAAAVFRPENWEGKAQDPSWHLLEECCPFNLIHVNEDSIEWENDRCTNCIACMAPMMARGLLERPDACFQAPNIAIADACLATMKTVGKENVGFINMAIDVSRQCDCAGFADVPIVPHLGVFGGRDPVALDKACVDAATKVAGVPGSYAEDMEVLDPGLRKFEMCSAFLSGLSEEMQINTGEAIGLGTSEYELVQVPEKSLQDFAFPPDSRPVGVRLRDKFAKIPPFPYDLHEGRGFLREDEVDLKRVNKYYDS
jgi:uncharacterized Fe-S center protein